MFYRNSVAAIEKRRKEKLRQANIKEVCDKFKDINSSIYCSILVPSRLIIQPCMIEEFSRYD